MINKQLLKTNIHIVKQVIEFFSSEFLNISEYNNIKNFCLEKDLITADKKILELGFLSPKECVLYLNRLTSNSASGRIIDETIRALEEKNIIYSSDRMIKHILNEDRYRLEPKFAKLPSHSDLILNLILGFEYVIESYKMSVFKIENILNKKHDIGTGFLINSNNQNLIITNKHVVENHDEIKVYDVHDKQLEINDIFIDQKKDLALIILSDDLNYPSFYLNSEIIMLSEIITIGYPSVPMTNAAFQLYHKGEINSLVEDYKSNSLIIFSAKTSSGNSGSPVINDLGTVVGIVTEELFEKEVFYEKGKLPYYAALPANDIISFIEYYKSKK